MTVGLLVASENANRHTDTQNSRFISIDIIMYLLLVSSATEPDFRKKTTQNEIYFRAIVQCVFVFFVVVVFS